MTTLAAREHAPTAGPADPLLQPFTLGHLELRNRVVSASHEPSYTEDGMPKERYRRYHVEKARGGVGLTMIGGSSVVSPDSPPAFGNIEVHRDEVVPWLRALADEVHDAGAAVMIQLTHLGRRSSNFSGDWLPLVYPSGMREPAHRSFPKVAEAWDVDRIVGHYVAAARRCRAAGLDGVELEAYGHLLDGFLSPATNDRDDAYGGDADRRRAFGLRVVREIRAAVGDDFLVGVRMSMDECLVGGVGLDEAVETVDAMAAEGVGFLSVIRGTIDSDATLAKVIPSMGGRSAPHLEFAGQVRARVGVPVMHSSMISEVATARHAISAGLLDLVGLTRPQIADPHLVAKVARGEEDRIRPCVGANYCLDAIYESGDAKCLHNAATGRELLWPQLVPPTERARRRAVVVGAGIAGLEAARVLGERGHDVTVLEANAAPGGQVRLAAAAPRRRDLVGVVDWRVAEAAHLGVEIRCGVVAEPDDVLALDPDVVVVATGGLPNTDVLDAGAELVLDTWDVLSGDRHPTGTVLVYDDHGGEAALGTVELLAGRGCDVELVTPERTVGIGVGGMNSPGYLTAFATHDVRTTLATRLRSVSRVPGSRRLVAELGSDYTDRTWRREVDAVVVEHGTVPADDLYHRLVPGSTNLGEVDQDALLAGRPQAIATNPTGGYQLFRIGDAVCSRNIHAAVYDALRLCVAI
ncbi:FAD-dependent oxidoreductase [Nocardioides sp. CFH 31398]|uniref:oxidoreductase n=1 Tax=Nocardioides sp. CFH 31398 TaxID=2919579 RepID=UPI001F063D92|nr:FAD-dependent oxidoreductase [Nocardioides sp. CFH 31398]MCH1866228.1 FAD-dependent oxidoreductase [Nocardioides sp. CFH 31398]